MSRRRVDVDVDVDACAAGCAGLDFCGVAGSVACGRVCSTQRIRCLAGKKACCFSTEALNNDTVISAVWPR